MKLCFLASANSIHSLKWIKYFAQKGHEIHWLSLTPALPEIKDIPQINFYRFTAPSMPVLLKLYWQKIKPLIQQLQPDILQAHYAGMNGLLTALSGVHPLVITTWGSDILLAGQSLIKRPLIKYSLRQADLITCDAEHIKQAMVRLGTAVQKIKLINFGIDTKKFFPQPRSEEIRKKLGVNDNPLIISLRHLEPIYDVGSLIRAMALVHQKIPQAHCLIISRGSQENDLKKLAQSLGLEQKVLFIGSIPNDQLVAYLTSADVYVSTALSDAGIAASTAEAMACALPVVITKTGENEKWVQSGKGGFLVPVKSPQILSQKVILLLKNQSLRKQFGRLNRQIIQEKNNYYQEMGKMEKIYQELCSTL